MLVGAGYALAWLTYRFVEQPIHTGSWRHRATSVLAGAMALPAIIGLAAWQMPRSSAQDVDTVRINATIGDGPTCPIFFGAGEPCFADDKHLRPGFVAAEVIFLDNLLALR